MIPYLACMLTVAAAAHLPPRILPVIHAIEGGAAGTVTQDANGTADLGVMQVNSLWIPAIAAQARMTEAAARNHLVNDACFNIAAAALILRVYLRETNGALLPAIGDYHSHTPPLNRPTSPRPKQWRGRYSEINIFITTPSNRHEILDR